MAALRLITADTMPRVGGEASELITTLPHLLTLYPQCPGRNPSRGAAFQAKLTPQHWMPGGLKPRVWQPQLNSGQHSSPELPSVPAPGTLNHSDGSHLCSPAPHCSRLLTLKALELTGASSSSSVAPPTLGTGEAHNLCSLERNGDSREIHQQEP